MNIASEVPVKALADTDHLLRPRDREQTKRGAVQHGKDADVDPDAQSNGGRGGKRKPWVLPQHTHSVADVLPEGRQKVVAPPSSRHNGILLHLLLHTPQAPRQSVSGSTTLTALSLSKGRRTQLFERHAAGFIFYGPAGDKLLVAVLEVLRHLFDDLRFARRRQIQIL